MDEIYQTCEVDESVVECKVCGEMMLKPMYFIYLDVILCFILSVGGDYDVRTMYTRFQVSY